MLQSAPFLLIKPPVTDRAWMPASLLLLNISTLEITAGCEQRCPIVCCQGMPLGNPFAAGPSAGERFAQRRTVPRYALAWPVEIFEPISRTRFAAQTSLVSVKGCCVRTRVSLEKNTIVRLEIERRQQRVEVWARVTGTSAGSRMGLAFLGTRHQDVLTRWISAENKTSSPRRRSTA